VRKIHNLHGPLATTIAIKIIGTIIHEDETEMILAQTDNTASNQTHAPTISLQMSKAEDQFHLVVSNCYLKDYKNKIAVMMAISSGRKGMMTDLIDLQIGFLAMTTEMLTAVRDLMHLVT